MQKLGLKRSREGTETQRKKLIRREIMSKRNSLFGKCIGNSLAKEIPSEKIVSLKCKLINSFSIIYGCLSARRSGQTSATGEYWLKTFQFLCSLDNFHSTQFGSLAKNSWACRLFCSENVTFKMLENTLKSLKSVCSFKLFSRT